MDHENITWENNYKNVHENKQNMQQQKNITGKKNKINNNILKMYMKIN